MPKKKPATKKEPNDVIFLNKLKAFYRKRPWLFIIVAGLLLWGIAWLSQVAVERYQFSKAESKIDEFSFQSVNEANKISDAKERYCVYSSAKFSKGTLRCSVYRKVGYRISSVDDANKIARSIIESLSKNSAIDTPSISSVIKDFPANSLDNVSSLNDIGSSFNFKNLTSPECHLTQRISSTEGNKKLEILIGCTSESKLEYFPVR